MTQFLALHWGSTTRFPNAARKFAWILMCSFGVILGLSGCDSPSPAPIDKEFSSLRLVAGDKDTLVKKGFLQFERGSVIPFEGQVGVSIECHTLMIKLVSLGGKTPLSVTSSKAELFNDGGNRRKYSGVLSAPETSGPHTVQVIHPRIGLVDELVIYVGDR